MGQAQSGQGSYPLTQIEEALFLCRQKNKAERRSEKTVICHDADLVA